jgi:adenine phosphoribosyltransferase
MEFALTSNSSLKYGIVFDSLTHLRIGGLGVKRGIGVNTYSTSGTPEQPLNSALKCCQKRIENLITQKVKETHFISIENGIEEKENGDVIDICYVVLKTPEKEYIHRSEEVEVDHDWFLQAIKETPNDYEHRVLGLSVTIGEIINRENPDIPFGLNRQEQIRVPLFKCLFDFQKDQLQKNITFHKDFPKPGVIFQDMSHILNDPLLLKYLTNCMTNLVSTFGKIDQVVGLDSRGFIYGPLIAQEIGAGFVMVRKPGKLPSETVSTGYETEYSSDKFEILKNVIKKGDKVLIVDDLVATGGSLLAAKTLVESVGGDVVGNFTVLKVDPLFEIASKKIDNLVTLF